MNNDDRQVAERKLQMLDIARRIDDLRIPPANRLEALKGDRKGQHSIRVNNQWRICFRWKDGDALDVETVDYHSGLRNDKGTGTNSPGRNSP